MRTEVTVNQRLLEGVGVFEGESVLLLDGIVLQEGSWDVFRLVIFQHRSPLTVAENNLPSCALQLDWAATLRMPASLWTGFAWHPFEPPPTATDATSALCSYVICSGYAEFLCIGNYGLLHNNPMHLCTLI